MLNLRPGVLPSAGERTVESCVCVSDPSFMYVTVDNSSATQYSATPTVSSPIPTIPLKKSVSTSSLQARQQQRVVKKDVKTVRCNLCYQMLQNDEDSLLDHVQRMHGA